MPRAQSPHPDHDQPPPPGRSLEHAGPKEAVLKRLRRAEGQIRGLHAMVDDERPCADVLTQLAAAQQALRAVGRELLRSHLKHCVAHTPPGPDADAMHDELIELFYKNAR
jgi:DNA-binding FrmR family transcriptional regulator